VAQLLFGSNLHPRKQAGNGPLEVLITTICRKAPAFETRRKYYLYVNKTVLLLVCLIATIAFSAVGLALAVLPLARTLHTAFEVESWKVEEATIESVDLRILQGRKGIRTYRLTAKYRYSYAGTSYLGSRIGLDEGNIDNIGDWYPSWLYKLENAQKTKQTVEVRINPNNPSQALLDPQVHWSQAALHGFFLMFLFMGFVTGHKFFCLLIKEEPNTKESTPGPIATASIRLSFVFCCVVIISLISLIAFTYESFFSLLGVLFLCLLLTSDGRRLLKQFT
jgi:hypothetical protein